MLYDTTSCVGMVERSHSIARICVPHGLGRQYRVMKHRVTHTLMEDLQTDTQRVRMLTSRI